MDILSSFLTEPHRCAYLPRQQATLQYYLVGELDGDEYERLMDRGFRKFGNALFQPVCGACELCRPIRIPVNDFKPDRSQRRCLKRNEDLMVLIDEPIVDAARLDLYHRYHRAQSQRKGWDYAPVDECSYEDSFVSNPLPGLEVSVWRGDTLLGLAINDVTPKTLSAVYHFYDPDHIDRGLGTFLILNVLALARDLGRSWVYLGYHVSGCADMEYKRRYEPYEILGTDAVWRRNEQK